MDGLTHYTDKIDSLLGILKNGFAWVPNRRNLMPALVPHADFSQREPQQFGMISFTDWPPPAPLQHRQTFGDYGIIISREWALAEKPLRGFHPENVRPALRAQRVLYIDDGPLVEALRWLFTTAFERTFAADSYDVLSATNPMVNRAMAGLEDKMLWANLLTLYEYFEPGSHAFQREWRIVHPIPRFGYPPKAEIIKSVTTSEGWSKVTDSSSLRPPADAIVGFVCPSDQVQRLRSELPAHHSSKVILGV